MDTVPNPVLCRPGCNNNCDIAGRYEPPTEKNSELTLSRIRWSARLSTQKRAFSREML